MSRSSSLVRNVLGLLLISTLASCGTSQLAQDATPIGQRLYAMDSALYYLPWPNGMWSTVTQGNIGDPRSTHVDQKYAVDFGMAEGRPILAARDGVITLVEPSGFNCYKTCASAYLMNGKFIKVQHSDGTTAAYLHLSAIAGGISKDVSVSRGRLLGYSGNTGNSGGPHLHFQVRDVSNAYLVVPFKEVLDKGIYDPLFGPGIPRYNTSYTSQNSDGGPPPPPPGDPWSLLPGSLTFGSQVGSGISGQSVYLQNRSSGTLSYRLATDQSWVRNFPKTGSLAAGQGATIPVEVDGCSSVGGNGGSISVDGSSARVSVNRQCGGGPTWPSGQFTTNIPKARTSNLTLDWDGGAMKLWTSISGEGNQIFRFYSPGQFNGNSEWMILSLKYGKCLEFTDELRQGKEARFVDCTASSPNQQFIMDGGSYLGWSAGFEEWNIRPRRQPTWCLAVSVDNRPAQQGDSVVWKQDSCDQPDRRWLLPNVTPPGPAHDLWAENDTHFPVTTVGGAAHLVVRVYNGGGGVASGTVSATAPFFIVEDDKRFSLHGKEAKSWSLEYRPAQAGTDLGVVEARFDDGAVRTIQAAGSSINPPAPVWVTDLDGFLFSNATGGGAPEAQLVSFKNAGDATGSFVITGSKPWLHYSPAQGAVAAGAISGPVAVTVDACTQSGQDSGVLTLMSPGFPSRVSLNVTRRCSDPPQTPNGLVVAMSSSGRALLSWLPVAGVDAYDFQVAFDHQPAPSSSRIAVGVLDAKYHGAALAFTTDPAAPDKQGKQLCVTTRSVSAAGVSAFTSEACTTYRFYTLGAGALSDHWPTIFVAR